MVVATVAYRKGIDVDYYLTKHVPRSEELMVPLGLQRAEVRQYSADQAGGAPAFAVMTTLYFPSLEIFRACMQSPVMAELMDDIKNFYHGQPEVFVGEELVARDYRKA